jgi:uncharacterized cupredoxin-like copper-binding protein
MVTPEIEPLRERAARFPGQPRARVGEIPTPWYSASWRIRSQSRVVFRVSSGFEVFTRERRQVRASSGSSAKPLPSIAAQPTRETMKAILLRSMILVAVLALACTSGALAGVARHTASAQAKAATLVKVTFTDSTLRLSNVSLQSGATTFVVFNNGKKQHVFSIKGPGVNGMHTATLAAGKSAKLTVKLRAGAYVLSDPVGLGAYNVQFLDVVPSAVLTGAGGTNVVAPPVTPPPMCGATYTP